MIRDGRINAYEKKYGMQTKITNYVIRFNPNLSVIKII